MTYSILITETARKDIKKLDPKTRKLVKDILLEYRDEPLKATRGLTDYILGTYRIRMDDFRVVFDIEKRNIIILRIGHR